MVKKYSYTFVHKGGRVTKKKMTPNEATKYGEKKSVKLYGLSSRIIGY